MNVVAVSKGSSVFSYEEWCRKKDTEDRLREQLIQEAKRELKEEMERKEQEESRIKEKGAQKVDEWREAKAKEVAARLEMKRMAHMKKLADEEERREKGRHCFKQWLKDSLLSQRKEKMKQDEEQRQKERREQKENREKAKQKIDAQIAFKRWAEKKKQMEEKQRKIAAMEEKKAMQEGMRRERSRGEVFLAYSLNKNMKQLQQQKRPQSAKPKHAKKKTPQQLQAQVF